MDKLFVQVSEEEVEVALEFAAKRSGDVAVYESRGGFKSSDIVNGALAEIAVFNVLVDLFPDVTEPDFNIYDKSRKTFDADLKAGDLHFHVKGQSISSAERYTESWLMQRFDPILKRPKENHFLVPCVVDVDRRLVLIHGMIPLVDIVKENAIDECTVPRFRATKVALRLSTFIKKFDKSTLWAVKGLV